MKWFSFDGDTFEVHDSEQKARETAENAMVDYHSDAVQCLEWCEESLEVCYGIVTHHAAVTTTLIQSGDELLYPECTTQVETHELIEVTE